MIYLLSFCLFTFLLIEALVTKEIKLKEPRTTLKDNPNTYKLFVITYSALILFSLITFFLDLFGLIE